ncbi:M23 family metallopeptidase [Halalkalibacter hemicellulosilyticus]|uniref:Stage II sporulation protein related to metaloproteases n=1 Tax=Halalkalibacter hemicellulosilyticusJCM 9152 TaxID=1236971 RepID=W4QGS9_9BACI|nr:M23 family metallopeptidase [Halalkalibacter hemicellulosilyticus]GAE31315.1 stage II sporulation protein related to metaloproteases [Halalkalibacter hemicellulosilyticusJCM 9152]
MREDNNRSSNNEETKINIRSILRKRWVIPALYLAAAALVLSAVFMLQNNEDTAAPETGMDADGVSQYENPYGEDALPVTSMSERVQMPFENEHEMNIVGYFYDVHATAEEQQEALVYYNNEYYPNKGMDFAHVDGESFDVIAALSGTVVRAEKDELLGYIVEISHEDDVVTHYHSLEKVEVEQGDTVEQGDVLGTAGRNVYNKDAGIHVHFEIRQDQVAINPNNVFDQPIDAIEDIAKEQEEDEKEAEEEQDPAKDDQDESDSNDESAESHELHS